MKALREPKCLQCAEMSILMYTFPWQNDTEQHSAGNEVDQSPSTSCQEFFCCNEHLPRPKIKRGTFGSDGQCLCLVHARRQLSISQITKACAIGGIMVLRDGSQGQQYSTWLRIVLYCRPLGPSPCTIIPPTALLHSFHALTSTNRFTHDKSVLKEITVLSRYVERQTENKLLTTNSTHFYLPTSLWWVMPTASETVA